jgi:hypothetical protein
VYGRATDLYFNDYDIMLNHHDKNSFDVVVLCNVLHEIDPKTWLKLFGTNGAITSLLKEDGVLLVVEDTQMPIGEKAYHNGFIVLNTSQLKDLFVITPEESIYFNRSDARGDDRLQAHKISKRLLGKITATSRIMALRSVREMAQRAITKIREQKADYKQGKLHAFYVQQFANASLALAELTGEDNAQAIECLPKHIKS